MQWGQKYERLISILLRTGAGNLAIDHSNIILLLNGCRMLGTGY
jgi:hypothetical protein